MPSKKVGQGRKQQAGEPNHAAARAARRAKGILKDRGKPLPAPAIDYHPVAPSNPGGRARGYREMMAACREFTGEAIELLATMIRDEKAPEAVRLKAAEVLLNRGWGQVPQQHVVMNLDRDDKDPDAANKRARVNRMLLDATQDVEEIIEQIEIIDVTPTTTK